MNLTPKWSNSRLKSVLRAPAQHKKISTVILLLVVFYLCTGKSIKIKNFDYFVFSQRWLPTACIEYMEHGSSPSHAHFCKLPRNFEFWAVHGLWPTQCNHMGPFYCNKSMPFDIKKLQSMESDLTSYWPNIQGGESVWSLWQHEWEKHGTCAAQLKSLNSEIKYFSTALKVFKTHNIQDLFRRNNILPSPNPQIAVSDLFLIIKNAFGKLPQIHCIQEVKKKLPYLSEIRLCYDKNLQLMNCNSIIHTTFNGWVDVTSSLTNCPLQGKVVLPNKIDLGLINKLQHSGRDYYDMLVDILNVLRFLQWASI